MRTKSRRVRRNSSAYELQDDVCVSVGDDVNDARPPTPVLENLGPDVSLSFQKDTVSPDVVVRGDEPARSVGMGISFGCNRDACGVVQPPVIISGGITINEPDSYRHSAHVRSQTISGSVDYVGKGKRKADDILSPSYNAYDDVPVYVSATSLAAENTNHVGSSSSTHSVVGTSPGHSIICHPNNAYDDVATYVSAPSLASQNTNHVASSSSAQSPGVPHTNNDTPGVMNVVGQNTFINQPIGRPVRARASASYTRTRTAPRTAARRAPSGSSVPVRNIGGAPASYASLGRCNRVCRHCNALFWFAERVKIGGVRFPEYHRCCMGGKVVLRRQPDYPLYLKQLFTLPHFMDNIRAYNSMFAMTSLGAQVDDSVNRGHGPYVFKVSGQIYHWIGGLCPSDDNDPRPRFLQMYIFDTDNEVENRMQHFDAGRRTLNPQIVEALIHLLDDHNELVRIFRTARDLLAAGNIPEFKIRLFAFAGSRQHELPSGDSIGAIVYEGSPDTYIFRKTYML